MFTPYTCFYACFICVSFRAITELLQKIYKEAPELLQNYRKQKTDPEDMFLHLFSTDSENHARAYQACLLDSEYKKGLKNEKKKSAEGGWKDGDKKYYRTRQKLD